MNKMISWILVPLLLSVVATPTAAKKNEPPAISVEGLTLVEKDRRGEIYADTDVDWGDYSKIQLQQASVAFKKNWKREQNRYQSFKVRDQDMEKIKTGLSDLFHEVFTEELSTEGGYVMTATSAEDVMTIIPSIVDLDVVAPDTRSPGITTTYTEQAGRMTLKLEIYDSQTGDLIAKMSDRQESPRRGYMQWTNSVTNTAEARRMLKKWAKALRVRLDEARSNSPAE